MSEILIILIYFLKSYGHILAHRNFYYGSRIHVLNLWVSCVIYLKRMDPFIVIHLSVIIVILYIIRKSVCHFHLELMLSFSCKTPTNKTYVSSPN